MNCLHIEDVGNTDIGPINLELRAAECVCLSGPSGAGKSRLLRAIADLDTHNGSVSFNDQACADMPGPQWRRKVGLLAAESAWWAETVGEHFADVDTAQLTQLGFTDEVMAWSVDRLSTGEKQRLALLRLLANKPDVLLLDEPTSNLDPDSLQRVEKLVMDYCKNKPAVVLWVSHDNAQIDRLGDRHFAMLDGQLLAGTSG